MTANNYGDSLRPTYAAAFRCIGADCEDHCCKDWEIPLDRETYEAYQRFSPGKLGAVVSEFVILNPAGSPAGLYARIERRPSGVCSFLGADRLCSIQTEYGPKLLSATCSIYPRYLSRVEGSLEATLSLSCPEAARNVLLDPDFLQVEGALQSGEFRTDNFYLLEPPAGSTSYKPYRWFRRIRALVVALILDRARAIWQRIFLIGVLSLRLAEVTAETETERVPSILAELEQVMRDHALTGELEAMTAQPALRFDVVSALLKERMQGDPQNTRLQQLWTVFQESAAKGPEALSQATNDYYRPWMDRHPFVLENYLLNYVLQHLFPFGREGSAQSRPQDMADEFLLLAVHFACIEVLLNAVAAFHRQSFAPEHVVAAVQTFTRAVEHDPRWRTDTVKMVRNRGLGLLEGVVILLRG